MLRPSNFNSIYESQCQGEDSQSTKSSPGFSLIGAVPRHFAELQGSCECLCERILVLVASAMSIVSSVTFIEGSSRLKTFDHSN